VSDTSGAEPTAQASIRRPGKDDPSRAQRGESYDYKKQFYQDDVVARDYDFHRFGSPERARRNAKKWRTIERALAVTENVRRVLDLPCGTGRFTGHLAARGCDVVGADISLEMMRVAREQTGDMEGVSGFVRADAEALPFADGAFDCVMSIRFLFHVDPRTRIAMLREMARVSRRWLLLDYRHKYAYRYASWWLRRRLRMTGGRLERVRRIDVERELAAAGIRLVGIFPVARVFSDKWIVLGEKRAMR
jgi:SAM-dependent methyltransferase